MGKDKEKFEGIDNGPGVDPIPVPDDGVVSSTEMLEEIVDKVLNDPKDEEEQNKSRE
ncbi:hypothetical protein DFP94_101584 [Fontibacillus phaseoli]|uniref:Uncharacterized protein n=1 Tax=Fontibacillus phaseoli TaxID=1416533 RepID=A0A369BTQ4_9BACL|nr:hypothetical protein [Fontibacillus phaseoli]RCX22994.1 hypothetical protein DFP94_101584 [Fontibacillus phaseoli]